MDISDKLDKLTKFLSSTESQDPLKQDENKAILMNILEDNKDRILPIIKLSLSKLRESMKESKGRTFIFTMQEEQMVLCIAEGGAITKLQMDVDKIKLYTDTDLIAAAENDTLGDFLNI